MLNWLIAIIAVASSSVAAMDPLLAPTLDTHLGPWYRPDAPIVKSLWKPGQPGQRLQLGGRVLNTDGAALDNALIELWHTDTYGSYPPLRASLNSRQDGSFSISTVMPGHNQGYRARHIHFVINHPDHQELVTRIYFKGDVNMDEAPYPELAVFVEEAYIKGQTVLHAEVEFVLTPR